MRCLNQGVFKYETKITSYLSVNLKEQVQVRDGGDYLPPNN